tara:strand:+ start:1530 stop:2159 length:630 start_codon:yes stop_codon:yes gene_type:complete
MSKHTKRPQVKTIGEKNFDDEKRLPGFAEDITKTNIQKDAQQRDFKSVQRKALKESTSNNYGTMKAPNNMGAPNFYVMNPGSPNKKMDTPGGFSYKASSTMNKLGFVDSGMNEGHEAVANYGHSPMPFDDTKKKKETKPTELDNVTVKAPKNITITEAFYTDPSGRPSKTTKEGHKIITKTDPNKYTLIDGKRKKGKIISQSFPIYDRS